MTPQFDENHMQPFTDFLQDVYRKYSYNNIALNWLTKDIYLALAVREGRAIREVDNANEGRLELDNSDGSDSGK